MPAVIPVALAAGGAIAGVYGANKQSQAAAAANTTTQQSNAAAQSLAQQQEQERKAEFDQQMALQKAQFDAEQSQQAPYRQASQAALGHLGEILGVNFGSGPTTSSGPAPPGAPGVVPMSSLMRPPAPIVGPTGPATQPNYQGVIPLASLARGY